MVMNEQEEIQRELMNQPIKFLPLAPPALDPWLWLAGMTLSKECPAYHAAEVADKIMAVYQKRQDGSPKEQMDKADIWFALNKVATPTVPGYYWVKTRNDNVKWRIVRADSSFGEVKTACLLGGIDQPIDYFTNWHGPIPEPSGVE
jgi:hypothetical protein